MKRALRVGVTATVLVLAACGSSSPGVSERAAGSLHTEIARLRAAAARHDRVAAAAEADRIEGLITQLRARHDLDATAERRLRDALGAVRAQLVLLPLPTTTTTTSPEVTEDGPGRGRGNAHAKGRKADG